MPSSHQLSAATTTSSSSSSSSSSYSPYIKYLLAATAGFLTSSLLSYLSSSISTSTSTSTFSSSFSTTTTSTTSSPSLSTKAPETPPPPPPPPQPRNTIRSPLHDVQAALSTGRIRPQDLPYPPDVLPGARDVDTPWGSIRVYEWGPVEDGDGDGEQEGKLGGKLGGRGTRKVLFVHGVSTPAMALGGLARELARRGCRVMVFDLFGRGYSDTPSDLAHDARLFITQILLVISSSPSTPSWTGGRLPGFDLVGYSLGGGVAVSFARYLPHLVRSLTLIAPSGLIRPAHIAWKSRLLYSQGFFPEFLLRYLVKRRLLPRARPEGTTTTTTTATTTPAPAASVGPDEVVGAELAHTEGKRGEEEEEKKKKKKTPIREGGNKDSDANGGGSAYDNAILSKRYPHISVASAVSWQIHHHAGFIRAFMSSIRHAPIYGQQAVWRVIGERLSAQRAAAADARDDDEYEDDEKAARQGLQGNKVLMVLGRSDPVVVADEVEEDARAALGEENVEVVLVDAGHELPITKSVEVAEAMWRFWTETG